MSDNKIYWHYTDDEGAKKIVESGKILPSIQNRGDAILGDGVYLTTKGPSGNTLDFAWARFTQVMFFNGYPSNYILKFCFWPIIRATIKVKMNSVII